MPMIINCPHCSQGDAAARRLGGQAVPLSQRRLSEAVRRPGAGRRPRRRPSVSLGSTPNLNLSGAAPKPAAPPRKPPTPTKCPACGSDLLPGAIACMDCGFLLQSDTGGGDEGPAPNLCPNPACGVANPPGERNCQRCSTPLPIAPGTLLHGRYASTSSSRWAASAPSTWPTTPRTATAPSPSRT